MLYSFLRIFLHSPKEITEESILSFSLDEGYILKDTSSVFITVIESDAANDRDKETAFSKLLMNVLLDAWVEYSLTSELLFSFEGDGIISGIEFLQVNESLSSIVPEGQIE